MSSSTLFGTKLREALKYANLTQKVAADRLNISPGSMTNYVHGRIPEAEILLGISRLCNRPMEWFLTDDEFVQYETGNPGLGARIRDATAWNGLTIKELADALHITGDEAGRIGEGFLPDPGIAAGLCRILDVSPDWLLNGKGYGPPSRGEFIDIQNNFFSALAKLVAKVGLTREEDLRRVLAGGVPVEAMLPQDGLKDELLANLQILLRSPAWTRRLQRGRTGAGLFAVRKEGAAAPGASPQDNIPPGEDGRIPQPYDPQQDLPAAGAGKELFSVAESPETARLLAADRPVTTAPGLIEPAADDAGRPAQPEPVRPGNT